MELFAGYYYIIYIYNKTNYSSEFNDRGIKSLLQLFNWTQFVYYIYYYYYYVNKYASIGVNLFYLQFLFQKKIRHPTTVRTIFTTYLYTLYMYIRSRSIMTWCLYNNCISVANSLVTFLSSWMHTSFSPFQYNKRTATPSTKQKQYNL